MLLLQKSSVIDFDSCLDFDVSAAKSGVCLIVRVLN